MNTETRVVPDKLFSPSLSFSFFPIERRYRNQKKTNRRKDFKKSTLGAAVDLTSLTLS